MRCPVNYCPKNVVSVLQHQLKRVNDKYLMPVVLNLVPSETFAWYMKGIYNKVAVVIDTDLFPSTEVKPYLKCQWGSWHGDSQRPLSGLVNNEKATLALPRNRAVIKCYVDFHQLNTVGEIILNPLDMPAPIAQIELTKRERDIMFVFGSLKNKLDRFVALERLSVIQEEIDGLCALKAIKLSPKGDYVVTIAGYAARSDVPTGDLW